MRLPTWPWEESFSSFRPAARRATPLAMSSELHRQSPCSNLREYNSSSSGEETIQARKCCHGLLITACRNSIAVR